MKNGGIYGVWRVSKPLTERNKVGKRKIRNGVAILLMGFLTLAACAAKRPHDRGLIDPPVAPATRLPTLFIIGDSTVKNRNGQLLGWGDPIQDYFDKTKILVVNRALGGRSSRTYLREGLWDKVLAEMKPGDFVLMQFGHNDGGSVTQGVARASLKGNGDETQEFVDTRVEIVDPKRVKNEIVHTYGWYLRKYIADTKIKGATAIVLSPVPRNIWTKDQKVARASNDYGKWASEAAKEGGAAFVDLNEIVSVHYEEIGPEKVKELYFGQDHTHTIVAGARLNAASVVEGLKALKDCPLCAYLVAPPPDSSKPNANTGK